MSILIMVCIGFVVGLVAEVLLPGKYPSGFILTSLIGIGGSLVASFFGNMMGGYGVREVPGFIAAVLGAMVLLLSYKAIRSQPS